MTQNEEMTRTTAQNAQLALLLEVTGTPKPGNVDRARDYPDLRFEHFLTGAVGATPGLEMAAGEEPLGAAFERAVAGMAQQGGGNTQFGALLVLCPLVRASASDEFALTPEGAASVVAETTVADAANFYRAFEHVDVAVEDHPETLEALDVRRGADAIPVIEKRELTLADVMAESASVDGIAREWVEEFERSFRMADRILADEGPIPDRAARGFLDALATEPDTFVVKQHDVATARETTERARVVRDAETGETGQNGGDCGDGGDGSNDGDCDEDDDDLAAFADDLVAEGINPGTTADLVAAGLFIALERGLSV